MKACIHRGTKEIGGTCVEIEAHGKRIVLDVGLPLDVADPDQFPLYPVKGFEKADPNLLGVIIAHPHQDHYGLAYGLGASIWTRDVDRAMRLTGRIEAGAVFVNGMVKSDARMPFGGVKQSGYGRELSDVRLREFVNIKTVWVGDHP